MRYLIPCLVTLAGLAAFVMVPISWADARAFEEEAIQRSARITGVERGRGTGGSFRCELELVWNEDGVERTDTYPTEFDGYQVGDEVTIFVRGDELHLDRESRPFLHGPLQFGLIGLALTAIGSLALNVERKKGRG